jgi:hypothetical protein
VVRAVVPANGSVKKSNVVALAVVSRANNAAAV